MSELQMANNTRRVFIVHGWGGYPEEGCFPWVKRELESRGFSVVAPAMPTPLEPKLEEWIPFLAQAVSMPDGQTFFIGHSIGAQTVLRYLATLREGVRVGGVVLVAPWVHLTDEAFEEESDRAIAKPWLETPMPWDAIKTHAPHIVAIFSENDPLVPMTDAKVFEKKLGAWVVVEHNKGHFSGSDGITELPSVLNSLLGMALHGKP
jgi:predicted alpha/beta hydrolase family esterase